MPVKPTILISEVSDRTLFSSLCADAEKAGFCVKTVKSDGEAVLTAICENAPDAVLINMILPRFDALEVKKRYAAAAENDKKLRKDIYFFAMGSFNTPQIEQELSAQGFDYYFVYPLDTEYVCAKIRREISPQKNEQNESEISVILHRIGMPMHMTGFKYACDAISLMVEDMENGGFCGYSVMLTKRLYPEIAQKYNTTAAAVERNIRTAINAVFKNPDYKQLGKLFPLYGKSERKSVSNLQFLVTVSGVIHNRNTVKIS